MVSIRFTTATKHWGIRYLFFFLVSQWQSICQEWCRYPTCVLATVRSGAGTPRVPWQLSGVVQIPHRCPGNCQKSCRYPTDALATVRSGLVIRRLSVSQGVSLGDLLLAPMCPIEKVTVLEGFLMSGTETDEGVEKDKVFAQTGNWTRTPGPKSITLSTRLSLHPKVLINYREIWDPTCFRSSNWFGRYIQIYLLVSIW